MDSFTSLPPEIRNMVYESLLFHGRDIRICSIRSRRRRVTNRKSKSATTNFCNMALLCKKIHGEVCTIFYSENSFVVGNGNYGSTSETNIRGLEMFIQRVPAPYIACISRLTLSIHLRAAFQADAMEIEFGMATKADVRDLDYMSRAVAKHFTGIRQLAISPATRSLPRGYDFTPRLTREQSFEALTKSFEILLWQSKIQDLIFISRDYHKSRKRFFTRLQEAGEEAEKRKSPEGGKDFVDASQIYCIDCGWWCDCGRSY